MCDRITYCDIVECAECPKYGDDCDGDKRNDDLISRADAIEAVCDVVMDEFNTSATWGYDVAEKALSALPSAEPSLKAIKRQIDEHWYLDAPSAEAVSREDIIGYIDRVRNSGLGKNKALEYIRKYVERTESADAVQGEWIECLAYNPDLDADVLYIECDQCGHRPYFGGSYRPKYCEECGARMTKGGDSE